MVDGLGKAGEAAHDDVVRNEEPVKGERVNQAPEEDDKVFAENSFFQDVPPCFRLLSLKMRPSHDSEKPGGMQPFFRRYSSAAPGF